MEILDLMNKYQRIDLLVVEETDLLQRSHAIFDTFSHCRTDLEEWLLLRKVSIFFRITALCVY